MSTTTSPGPGRPPYFIKLVQPDPPPPLKPKPSSVNQTQRSAGERRIPLAGRDRPIPLAYGRVRIAPIIGAVTTINADLLVLCIWCMGEIDAIEALLIDGKASTVPVTHYIGTQTQLADPWFSSAIVDYGDTLASVAYSVLRIPSGTVNGWPRIEAIIRGRKVYDPREVHDLQDPGTWVYSTNPALHLADFIRDPISGIGALPHWASVPDAADACDEDVSGSPRRAGHSLIDRVASVAHHVEALRSVAGCLVVPPWRLVPDRPVAVSRTVGADQIIDGSLALSRPSLRDLPTVVEVTWTDASGVDEWVERVETAKASGVDSGTTPRRVSAIRLSGIHSAAQAQREAVERLNAATLSDLSVTWTGTDEALADEVGDVIKLTHPIGLTDKSFRLIDAEAVDPGRWRFHGVEYDAAVYSDIVVADPSTPDTSLPSPLTPPTAPETVDIIEEVYQVQTGTYATRLRITWTASAWPYVTGYRCEVHDPEQLVHRFETALTEVVTGPIQEGLVYTVSVVALTVLLASEGVEDSIQAQGKQLVPGNVPQLNVTRIGADRVHLTWSPAIDVDIWRYEVRQGGSDWDTATRVDRTDGLALEIEGLALGTHTFRIRAIDSVGHVSAADATVSITLTAPTAPLALTGFEAGGVVRLSWPESVSPYVGAYEIRYGAVGGSWASAETLDVVRGLRLVIDTIPAGTWRFYARAVDDAGNRSNNEAALTLSVTTDANAFLVDQIAFDSPTLTNVHSFSRRNEGRATTYYYTDFGESVADLFSAGVASDYTAIAATYHQSGSSEWLSEAHDFGITLSGNWTVTVDATALSGVIAIVLELSDDAVIWTQYGLSAKATARYARVRINAASSATLYTTLPGVSVRVDVVPREAVYTDEDYDAARFAVYCDGINQYLSLPGPSISTTATIEFWALLIGGSPPLLMRDSTDGNGWILGYISSGTLHFRMANVQLNTGVPEDRLLGRSCHYAWVKDGATAQFILNGQQEFEYDGLPNDASVSPWYVLRNGGFPQCSEGSIRDIRIWSTARTQQQIQDNLRADLVGTETGLIGYWPCNDGTGTTVADIASTNNGTLINAPTWPRQGRRLFLPEAATAFKSVSITPQGSVFRSHTADQLTPGESLAFFDVFGYDSAGDPANMTFSARAQYV